MEHAGPSPALRAAARSLQVDAVTAEVVSKLREAAVRPILLKGPSIAAWLYADGTPRPYGDTDLLIEPQAVQIAAGVLRAAGFREQPGVSSYTWFRRPDGSIVDLHETLFGIEAAPDEVWAALSEGTEAMRVGGVEVEVLSRAGRLLYIVLHAAQHQSDGFGQPLKDLDRVLHRADTKYQLEGVALARRLRALPTFAAGLRLHTDGARLADRLDLPHDLPLMLSLRQEGEQSLASTIERLVTTSGLRARFRLLTKRLAPPTDYMRWLYPALTQRGRLGLALAYVWRPLSIIAKLPAAVIAWKRARRAS
jgi:hypothetical protein